jgi:hypothetical protein
MISSPPSFGDSARLGVAPLSVDAPGPAGGAVVTETTVSVTVTGPVRSVPPEVSVIVPCPVFVLVADWKDMKTVSAGVGRT